MIDHPNLANRIGQMREAGLSIDEVISTLGISWEMSEVVRRIVRKFETEVVLLARRNRFMAEIRNADELDKKWRVSYLMQSLQPKVITQNAVIRHFESKDRKEISLRQLMDLTISEQQHPWCAMKPRGRSMRPAAGQEGGAGLGGGRTTLTGRPPTYN